MKNLWIILIIGVLLGACQSENQNVLEIKNPIDQSRQSEPVTLKRTEIMDMFHVVPDNREPIVREVNGKILPSQLDDMNNDSIWDELAFTIDLKPNQTKRVKILFVHPDSVPDYSKKTNIRFARKDSSEYKEIRSGKRLKGLTNSKASQTFQMEGPGWENNNIAFRNYFDERNGTDIFGKTTSDMILDQTGINENYHEMQKWGMDILKVGKSLGAGSIALQINDSIYRLGPNCNGTYQFITEGPVRSSFRLSFEDFSINGETYNVHQTISIWQDSYHYISRVEVDGNKLDKARLITGIVNKHSDSLMVNKHNKEYRSIVTHAKQSVKNDYLGMGILIKQDQFIDTGAIDTTGNGVQETYYAALKIPEDKPVWYAFFSGWEQTYAPFAKAENFIKRLNQLAQKQMHPIEVTKYNKTN